MSAGAQPPPELAGRGERGGLRLRAAAMLVLLGVLLHGPQLAGPFTDGLSGDCGAMFSVMARNTERLGWRGLCPAINTAPPEPGELVDHYNHHPPGLPWMVFLATRLPVQAETAARLVALLLTLATVLLLADLATRLSGPAAGGAAGLLALLAPAGWHHGLLVNYETAALPPMLLLVRALVLQRGPTALAAAWGALSDWIAVAPLLLVRGVTWRRRVPAALAAGAVLAGSFVLGRLFAPGSPGETLAQARLASFLNPAFDGGAWVANVGRFLAALFGCALLPAACALLV